MRTKEGDDVFDFLPQIVAGGGAFAPGEVITRQIGTPAPEAEITSVAYADSTAEVTDQRGFDALVRGRTAHLLAIKKVNEVVQQSLADKFVTNHSAAISTQLKQAAVAP